MRTKRRRKSKRHYTFSTIGDVSPARKINYPGTGNFSSFSYDAYGLNVKIVEESSSTISSTAQFLSPNGDRVEQRNASGAISAGNPDNMPLPGPPDPNQPPEDTHFRDMDPINIGAPEA